MRLFSGLGISREGLTAHGTAMTVVADNVANSSTTGYKSERPNFGDMLAASVGALFGPDLTSSAGNGASVIDNTRDLAQGPIEQTGRPLDLAIEGNGYFTLTSSATSTDRFYTRAGNFSLDEAGRLLTADGKLVMGFTAESADTPVPITMSFEGSGAVPTTEMAISGNLNATSPIVAAPANPGTYAELQAASQFSIPTTVIDTLGEQHDVVIHFFHTTNLGWSARAFTDGAETGGTAGTPVALSAAVPFAFGADGKIPEGTEVNMAIAATWGGTGATSAITANLAGFSGYAASSYAGNVVANGNRPGAVVGTTFDESGNIYSVLDNGEQVLVGSLALTTFDNQTGLERAGSNTYIANESIVGDSITGKANADGKGIIKIESLENSNVDLANQFVDIIKYQRGYQANSQVIQTFNDVINTTLNIA